MENTEKYTEQSSMMKTISEDMLESVNGGKIEFGTDIPQKKGYSFHGDMWDCPACGFKNTCMEYYCHRCGTPKPR